MIMEKNMKRNTCITESLCCTAEIKHIIVNQIYFSKTKKIFEALLKTSNFH